LFEAFVSSNLRVADKFICASNARTTIKRHLCALCYARINRSTANSLFEIRNKKNNRISQLKRNTKVESRDD